MWQGAVPKTARMICLHIPTSGNHEDLPSDITKEWARNSKNTLCSLRRRTRSPQRDIGISVILQRPLALRYAQSNLLAIWGRNKRALLLRSRQPCQDMSESNRIRSNAKLRAPFLRNDFRQPIYACLCETVVCLACVAVYAGCRGDVDDAAWLAVGDAEVGGCFAYEFEGCSVMQGYDVLPLFVGHLATRGDQQIDLLRD